MNFDCPFGCTKPGSNLFVKHAADYQFKYVEFTWRQRCDAGTHFFTLRAFDPLLGRSDQSLFDGAEKIFITEWFGQIIDCASLHRLYTSRHAGASGNENELVRT